MTKKSSDAKTLKFKEKAQRYFSDLFQGAKPYASRYEFVNSLKRIGVGIGTLIAACLSLVLLIASFLPFFLVVILSARNLADLKSKVLHSPYFGNLIPLLLIGYMFYISFVNMFQAFVIPVRLVSSLISKFTKTEDIEEDERPLNIWVPLWNETKNLFQYVRSMFVGNMEVVDFKALSKHSNISEFTQVNEQLKNIYKTAFSKTAFLAAFAQYSSLGQLKQDALDLVKGIKDIVHSTAIALVVFIQFPIQLCSLFFTSYSWDELKRSTKSLSNTAGFELLTALSVFVLALSKLHHLFTIPVRGIITAINKLPINKKNTKQDEALETQKLAANDNYEVSPALQELQPVDNNSFIDDILSDKPIFPNSSKPNVTEPTHENRPSLS
ncbi:MAG: hypothetical protein A3F18_01125 [Legionellales bacterium RIFCSPHIGHO2_12_FULL_37_14]|nr:MAG: hypothetical protein A3F18_01125 [Legionellales bacterium RIFCSPHIGHO2_12_FULL_37_14]